MIGHGKYGGIIGHESTAGARCSAVNLADITAEASGATAAEDSWALSSEVVWLVVVSVLAVLAEEDRLVSWFPGYVRWCRCLSKRSK